MDKNITPEQEARLKKIGAISHEEMLDKHGLARGSKEREEYEVMLKKEIERAKNIKRNG